MNASRIARSAAAALLLSPAFALAQDTERATFYLVVGRDTVIVERSTRTATRLQFELFETKRHRMVNFDGSVNAAGIVEAATVSIFTSDRRATPAVRVGVRFLDDSVAFEQNGTTNWLRVGRGALPNMNPSSVLLEQALIRARALGGDSVSLAWVYLPAGPSVPVTIRWRGADSATVVFAGVTMRAAVSPSGRLLGGTIPAQNARLIRGPETSGDPPGRKSYAPPSGAPYTAQDVVVRTKAGLILTGTLTLPASVARGTVPAVVTITGSGTQDRDETSPGMPEYRPFHELADTLGRRGIAVLRLDDRGAGGSDAGPPTVTTPDFADDIRAAVEYLRSRPEIDPRRIGLAGHSEGGWIAPMVAASDSTIAAVVIMAGGVSPGRELVGFQQRYVVDSIARYVGPQRERALAEFARNTDSVATALPWMKFFLAYDGAPVAAQVRAPVLIVHGEKDYQVPVAEVEKTVAAIRRGGNRDVTAKVFPATNHLFVDDAGVGFSYEKLPSFRVRREVLGTMADWLAARLRP